MSHAPKFDTAKDYYAILGLSLDADVGSMKTAFFRLAKELHPDKTGADPEKMEKFKEVREAYEILTDPELREQYDAARLYEGFGIPGGRYQNPPPTPRKARRSRTTDEDGYPPTNPLNKPANECNFSDYYYKNYKEKPNAIPQLRADLQAVEEVWRDANWDEKDAKDMMEMYEEAGRPMAYREDWEQKHRECMELGLKKRRAKAVLKSHLDRARTLLKRRRDADARVKRADAARKRGAQRKQKRATRR